MFENPRRGRQAKTFTTTVPKILDQIVFRTDIFRKLPLGALDNSGTRQVSSVDLAKQLHGYNQMNVN